jgi:hypothetical protein
MTRKEGIAGEHESNDEKKPTARRIHALREGLEIRRLWVRVVDEGKQGPSIFEHGASHLLPEEMA